MRHSATSSGPAARWIAPSTPPPPSSDEFAALTMASTESVVMSAWTARSLAGTGDTGTDPVRQTGWRAFVSRSIDEDEDAARVGVHVGVDRSRARDARPPRTHATSGLRELPLQ